MIKRSEYSCLRCGGQHTVGDCPAAPPPPPPAPSSAFVVTQRLVDHIVARAQNSVCGLGNPDKPGKAYSISQYDPPNLHALAMLIVGAHFDKWDIISIVTAALEEVADLSAAGGPLNTSPPRGADADVIEATPGCPQNVHVIAKLERQRDEIASAYVKADIDLHDEKNISGALRAAILNIASAADVLTGTKGAGVRKHIWNLAAKALEASKPKKQNNE